MNARARFFRDFPKAVLDDSAAVFVGAGTSMAAGYPSWKDLLEDIAKELGLEITDLDDLTAVAQWAVQAHGAKRTRVLEAIREQIDPDYKVPRALEALVRLPIRHVWTTNYDRLIKRAFQSVNRPVDVRFKQEHLSIRGSKPGAVKIYQMHGSIEDVADIVISTDDYELYSTSRGGFLNLLQAHITSFTFLFMGLSLTDPNVRHILSVIREHFPDVPPTSYVIAKVPQRAEFDHDDAFDARLLRHQFWAKDLQRYGLQVIEVDSYEEIDEFLEEIERRVARARVWVSGSWPTTSPDGGPEVAFVYETAYRVGRSLARTGLALVSGSGLLVGSGSVSGFLSGLQESGSWDLERRLIARPFPQPLEGVEPNRDQWLLLRRELARVSGTTVFIGGMKASGEDYVVADGVLQERELTDASGGFLLPIGATGGAAALIAETLIGSKLATDGTNARRPTDDELESLRDPSASAADLSDRAESIIRRVTGT